MLTLVIGDSMVGRLSGRGVQLRGGGRVLWRGVGGARLSGLCYMLSSYLRRRQAPTTIVIHVGTNDLFHDMLSGVRANVVEVLSAVRKLFPDSRIIWSDILYRAFYLNEASPRAGKRSTNNINKYAHQVCRRLPNTCFIKHSHIFANTDHTLFVYDGVHLSYKGKQFLLDNWAQALLFFNAVPGAKGFPPQPYDV
jgi:lysophospholipase L1-like esterase